MAYPDNPFIGQTIEVGGTTKQWNGYAWINKTNGNHEPRIRRLEGFKSVAEMRAGVSSGDAGFEVRWKDYYSDVAGGGNKGTVKTGDSTSLVDDGGSIFVIVNDAVNGVWVEANLKGKAVNIRKFGAKGDGGTDSRQAIQNAFTYSYAVKIPRGHFVANGDITVTAPDANQGYYLAGYGRESKLDFTTGGLVFSGNGAKNSIIKDFEINTRTSEQTAMSIVDIDVNNAPTRWRLDNILLKSKTLRTGKGLVIRGGWLATVTNIVIQNFDKGLQILASSDHSKVGFNGITFVGGEIQGNDTGVEVNNGFNVNFYGTAIEGNYRNGCVLYPGSRNVTFSSAYFEANGAISPATTSDVRLVASSGTDTIFGVKFSNCTFLNAGGGQNAIWANKCSGLYIDEGCSFNGYTNRLYVAEIAANTVTGYFKAIAPNTAIKIYNDSNKFGEEKADVFNMRDTLLGGAVSSATPLLMALPAHAAKLGELQMLYEATETGDVFFRLTPVNVETGVEGTVLDIIHTSQVGFNYVSAAINFSTRNAIGTTIAWKVQRLGSSAFDTSTADVVLSNMVITSYQ